MPLGKLIVKANISAQGAATKASQRELKYQNARDSLTFSRVGFT
jgi:hypothetical protein